ncbi:glycoside hydrolase family 9 protein [Pedobacter sp. SYSU D00535]|uniref:glycoside hydrolase family 9 protein n=1 Tax=Pedobacter sp. SYSU D00535 TaxID=2810308 RepID=UPI001A960E9A|nr:glycoside hydrolase family 9 protein [Pedobacter sp. SYSU D00535]
MKLNTLFLSIASLLSLSCAIAQRQNHIRLNQLGFYPGAEKVAVVVGAGEGTFQLHDAGSDQVVFTGNLSEERISALSSARTRIADFTSFGTPGRYFIRIGGLTDSPPFSIQQNVLKEVGAATMKAFYYQRASVDLPKNYAGIWSRKAGHPDNQVIIHPSAASAGRPAGTVISAPLGWYDAGDYNKYIVNSGISMGTILSAYEDFPKFFKRLNLNIPESSNDVPDILDEALWNLRWMLAMQDPKDGGVYNKLTNPEFDPLDAMPEQAKGVRYVVQKGTAATLDFAAVAAQAARVYSVYKKEFPGLADSCSTAAKRAWEWAKRNPAISYEQNVMNRQFEPKINTGGYGDHDFRDEFIWAAAELYTATGDESYLSTVNLFPDTNTPLPSWSQVRLLGYYTLLRSNYKGAAKARVEAKRLILKFADSLLAGTGQHPYKTVMGKSVRDFNWGSNSNAANQGIALIQAFLISKDPRYLRGALSNVDYLLGRNATGYCFVTGFGAKSPLNPHHRPSVADGIKKPIPGFLVGGPNPGMQDNCEGYPSKIPDEAYADVACSYASNEIAINWNAPAMYLINAVEALQNKLPK